MIHLIVLGLIGGAPDGSWLLDGRLYILRYRARPIPRDRRRRSIPSRLRDRDANDEDGRGQFFPVGQCGRISARHDRDVGHGALCRDLMIPPLDTYEDYC